MEFGSTIVSCIRGDSMMLLMDADTIRSSYDEINTDYNTTYWSTERRGLPSVGVEQNRFCSRIVSRTSVVYGTQYVYRVFMRCVLVLRNRCGCDQMNFSECLSLYSTQTTKHLPGKLCRFCWFRSVSNNLNISTILNLNNSHNSPSAVYIASWSDQQ